MLRGAQTAPDAAAVSAVALPSTAVEHILPEERLPGRRGFF